MGVTMMNATPKNEPKRMTLDELFKKTFSALLSALVDTFIIHEEQSTSKDNATEPKS